MDRPLYLLAWLIAAVFFLIALAIILKGVFTPKKSLTPKNFKEAVDIFAAADKGTRWFIVFLCIWPHGSKKAAMMLIGAVVAVLGAFATLIAGSHGVVERLLKVSDAIQKALGHRRPTQTPQISP